MSTTKVTRSSAKPRAATMAQAVRPSQYDNWLATVVHSDRFTDADDFGDALETQRDSVWTPFRRLAELLPGELRYMAAKAESADEKAEFARWAAAYCESLNAAQMQASEAMDRVDRDHAAHVATGTFTRAELRAAYKSNWGDMLRGDGFAGPLIPTPAEIAMAKDQLARTSYPTKSKTAAQRQARAEAETHTAGEPKRARRGRKPKYVGLLAMYNDLRAKNPKAGMPELTKAWNKGHPHDKGTESKVKAALHRERDAQRDGKAHR